MTTRTMDLNDALQHEKAGRFAEAAAAFERVLAGEPGDAVALTGAARVAGRLGRAGAAAAFWRRALATDPNRHGWRTELILALLRADELAAAEAETRTAIERRPRDPALPNILGVVLKRQRRNAEAIPCFLQALKLDKAHYGAQLNLGNTQRELGDKPAAVQSYKRAAALRPKDPEAARLLACTLAESGDWPAAAAAFQRAILLAPKSGQVFSDRAVAQYNSGRFAEALRDVEKAVALEPDRRDHRLLQGKILRRIGDTKGAIEIFQALLQSGPNDPDVLLALGNVYRYGLGDLEQANDCYRKALQHRPGDPSIIGTLCGSLLNSRYADEAGHIEEASRLANELIRRDNLPLSIIGDLQSIFLRTADYAGLARLGDRDRLMAYWVATNDIGRLHNQLGRVVTAADRTSLVEYHRQWGDQMAALARQSPIRHPPRSQRRARIRIGIVSSDLRDHPVSYFALPIIEQYDRARFELYCYSFYPRPADGVQRFLAGKVDCFRVIQQGSDQAVAQIIADDDLDILFELGGSTMHNRLTVMAYKPAPIQVSWLGYPHSCGLPTIDYIMLDRYIKPSEPGLLIEKVFEMPETWVCLSRLGFRDEPIADGIPEDRAGCITFGTMNNPYKYTAELLGLWAAAMREVPGSRFLFVRPEGGTEAFRRNILQEFARHDIAAERIEFFGNVRGRHLSEYNRIDISLDTAPQTGGTTTCETLWMGVPVVTLVGPAPFERLSYSNISNAGLGDLCAFTTADFVAAAVNLAQDRPRRLALRHGLRQQIRESPLGRADLFVKAFQEQIETVLGAS